MVVKPNPTRLYGGHEDLQGIGIPNSEPNESQSPSSALPAVLSAYTSADQKPSRGRSGELELFRNPTAIGFFEFVSPTTRHCGQRFKATVTGDLCFRAMQQAKPTTSGLEKPCYLIIEAWTGVFCSQFDALELKRLEPDQPTDNRSDLSGKL
ncbi:hypothetical protein PG988_013644 [Apiospora saccharicola]